MSVNAVLFCSYITKVDPQRPIEYVAGWSELYARHSEIVW